jgi:hypothetical protein
MIAPGWIDPENDLPLTYQFFIQHNGVQTAISDDTSTNELHSVLPSLGVSSSV